MTRLAWLCFATLCAIPLLFLLLPQDEAASDPFRGLVDIRKEIYDSSSVSLTSQVYLARSTDSRVRLALKRVWPNMAIPVKNGYMHGGFFTKGVLITGVTASYSNRAIDQVTITHIPNLNHDFSQKYYDEVKRLLPRTATVSLVTNTP